MPFTPSHAVVALPFVRVPALLPGVIAIAAMAPDLPLYLNWAFCYCLTHEFPSMFTIGVPIALGLVLLWRLLFRPAVAEFLPLWVARRLPPHWASDWGSGWFELWGGRGAAPARRLGAAGLLLAALVIGVTTHVVWDAFTHPERWGTELLPWLAVPLGPYPIERWLQIVFSVLGLVVLAWWAVAWLRRQPPGEPPARALPRWAVVGFWSLWLLLPLASAGFTLLRHGPPGDPQAWMAFLVNTGVRGAMFVLAVTALAALFVLLRLIRGRRAAAE